MTDIIGPWADFVVAAIKAESNLARELIAHSGEVGAAREAVIRQVLGRILPPTSERGEGDSCSALFNN